MKQLKTDEKVDAILDRLNEPKEPEQGVFFNGQIFDAYAFIAKLIRKAKKRIVVIDSYVDDSAKQTPKTIVFIFLVRISSMLGKFIFDTFQHKHQ